MRNNFFLNLIFFLFFSNYVNGAEKISIQSKNISLDKNKEISIFEEDVVITTVDGNTLKSDYAEYDKKKRVY